MSVYQDLLNQLKTQLEDNTELSAFLEADIVWGNQDAKITDMPFLLVEPGGIAESKFSIPKRRISDPWEIELRGKVKNSVDFDSLLESYEMFEKVGNAIFETATFGNLASDIDFSLTENNAIGDNTREIVMLLQIKSQPFQEDQR